MTRQPPAACQSEVQQQLTLRSKGVSPSAQATRRAPAERRRSTAPRVDQPLLSARKLLATRMEAADPPAGAAGAAGVQPHHRHRCRRLLQPQAWELEHRRIVQQWLESNPELRAAPVNTAALTARAEVLKNVRSAVLCLAANIKGLDSQDERGWTSLHHAVFTMAFSAEQLQRSLRGDLRTRPLAERMPHTAVFELFEQLLEEGANPGVRSSHVRQPSVWGAQGKLGLSDDYITVPAGVSAYDLAWNAALRYYQRYTAVSESQESPDHGVTAGSMELQRVEWVRAILALMMSSGGKLWCNRQQKLAWARVALSDDEGQQCTLPYDVVATVAALMPLFPQATVVKRTLAHVKCGRATPRRAAGLQYCSDATDMANLIDSQLHTHSLPMGVWPCFGED